MGHIDLINQMQKLKVLWSKARVYVSQSSGS